ncbi:MAG: hypothetical protein DMF61_23425 [Blastocatellia bacterium AA13]|nr:MAG: hypothetical protein DMF61_23425 [Blastocatellia bacterium AA13]
MSQIYNLTAGAGTSRLAVLFCSLPLFWLVEPALSAMRVSSAGKTATSRLAHLRRKAAPKKAAMTAQENLARDRTTGEGLVNEAIHLRNEWKEESLKAAAEKYRSSIPLFNKAGDKRAEARVLLGWGEILATLGEENQALDRFKRALKLAAASGDVKLQVDILNRLVGSEMIREKADSVSHANQALDLAEKSTYVRGKADALMNLGHIAMYGRDPDKAGDYFNGALELYEGESNPEGQAETLSNLGIAYGDSGKVEKAQEYFARALVFAAQANNPPKEARINLAVGLSLTVKGRWQKALDLYRRTLLQVRQFGDRKLLVTALNGISDLNEAMGELDQALAGFEESLNLSRKIGDPGNRGTGPSLFRSRDR